MPKTTKSLIREHYGLAIDVTREQEHEHPAITQLENLLEDLVKEGKITNFVLTYTFDEKINQEISDANHQTVDDK